MGDLWEFLLLLPVLLGECIMPSGSSRILDFSGNVALGKSFPFGDALVSMKPLSLSTKLQENAQPVAREMSTAVEPDVDIDMREIYFLIMHFLSVSPCQRTYGQLWNELLEHQLLPRRYHAWYSRSGVHTGDENDDGLSLPLSYNKLVERYPHIEKDHLVKLLKQLIAAVAHPSHGLSGGNAPNAADVPTVLGTGSFSLLHHDRVRGNNAVKSLPVYMRWPHIKADQIRGLSLREIGGGFSRHHRAPSIRAACYAIAQPSTMVQKMENIKRLRGHRNAVYCAIFDCSGRYVITGSDDRLVKIWSMETAYCLASCRGHEGDITDLAVSSNNTLVASSSNDCIIRIWRLPDGYPISVLRGHTGAVTAIAFSPRPSAVYQLLSSSDDGTCRIWDARGSHMCLRVYVPRSAEAGAGRNGGPSTSTSSQTRQIFCCAFNANGTVFVTGSSDNLARVWNACKIIKGDHDQPNHEMDLLSGHENDVNYVQFSGCAVASRYSTADTSKEDNVPKFKNSWFCQDNIVTCSRDGSAIIWIPRPRRSHGKIGRWTRAYHLKVPPPPMPPQPPRGGPRQRILPTPRGVNMIIWSLDNRFVLAAIMDCRICVWNAADGSLVHSLTGHSQSTYVLDVHPFNPRIAMSAGYDGKLIVWDIWEGTPIKISEVAHFKLVDGKFSPDGTSIILSDDVGQLYILNTGQGESQKDAKNDQFFLGDYRPLVRDTQGNVIDQETQLVPYRRNMQDLLCDSSMIPYPEPYQSMYQQRRLGGLGLEWDPSFLRVSVENSTLDQDYQILPLPDLDVLINPLPEFIDAVDWEPEIELQSDDTDSEYNVTEEFSSDGEQECLSSSSSGDHDFTSADSDVENSHKDGFRRARRKKKKIKTEIVTSSGRRAKKRTLNECDGRSLRNNRVKFRNGRKRSKRRSSTSKTFRPQRAAARNALSLFSRITGTSTDGEDEYGTEDDISGSESTLLDSGMESDESGRSLQNEQGKHLKGNEISFTKPEDLVKHIEHPETHMANGSRRRLILKLPIRDSTKSLPSNSVLIKNDDQVDIVGPSSRTLEECAEPSKNILCSWDPGCLPEDVNDSRTVTGVPQPEQVEDHLNLSEGYKDGKIRWGGVKARTSKRQRIDAMPSAYAGENLHDDSHIENESSINGDIKFEKKYITFSCRSDIQNDGASNDKMALLEEQHIGAIAARDSSPAAEFNESSIFIKDRDNNKSPESDHFVGHGTGAFSVSYDNGTGHSPEMKRASTYMPTKVRFKSKSILRDPNNPAKLKIKSSGDDWRISRCGRLLDNNPSSMDQNLTSEALNHDDIEQVNSNPVDYDLKEPDGLVDVHPGTALQDAEELHVGSSKECNIVYKRSNKLQRPKFDYEGESGDMEESTSNASDQNHDFALSFHDGITSSTRKTRSMGLNASTSDPCSSNKYHKIPHEESKSSVQMTVRLRSARTRKGSKHVEYRSPTDKRKPHQPTRKQSWLMLPYHEYGPRYIPQQGDEVVYFRQGHQEYIESSGSRELGPWISVEGDVSAVEFCKVKGLEYATLAGSGESCCKMIIQFVDSDSGVFGKTFKLTLPEVTSFPDFLVEKGRFDDAMRRNWAFRDKCLVWWKNYGEEDGSWWEGRVSGITPKSLEFPDSPWDRYIIQYKGSSSEIQRHSPWELYDRDTRWEEPHIDDDIRKALLSSLDKLMESAKKNQDYYGVRKLKEISQKSKFINRFPVPLSLEVIHLRLQNNYYRSLEAMEHDAGVMLKNVETYVGKKVKDSIKLRRLSDWFKRILSQRSRKHSFVEVSP